MLSNMDKKRTEKMDKIIDAINNSDFVKKLKSREGLIERVDNEKIVLTEDNKMLLKD